jgi:hypothetical protein
MSVEQMAEKFDRSVEMIKRMKRIAELRGGKIRDSSRGIPQNRLNSSSK